MSEKIKKQLKQLICLVFIIFVIIEMQPLIFDYIDTRARETYDREVRKRTRKHNADTMENVLNNVFQEYKKNEKIKAIADTDEKMRAYKSLDEIYNVAMGLDVKNVEDYLETLAIENMPKKYYPFENEKDKGYKYWVLIEVNYNEGFTAEVKCAKSDPFEKRR